jgi:Phage integrase family
MPLLLAMQGWEKRQWLFGAGPNSGNSFRRDLKAACDRAGLDWYHPHSFGRHTSVTRMLRAGWSTQHVAAAHGMTEQMVARRYGHLTFDETMRLLRLQVQSQAGLSSAAALHEVGGDLFDRILNGGNAGDEKVLIDEKNGHKPVWIEHLPLNVAPELQPSEGDTLSS